MKWIKLFSVVIFLSGCGLFEKNKGGSSGALSQSQTLKEFERGNQLLDQNQFTEAAEVFDRLIVDQPTSQLDLLIIYNSGLAHLAAMNCDVAGERIRKAIRMAAQDAPSLRGRALLRMGDVYTCLGDDSKSITTLIEVMRGQFNLPVEVVKAEVPAKLAAAYARIGNIKDAEKFFRLAERGLIQVETSYRNPQEKTQAMGMTLFLMGNIAQINIQTMPIDEYFATVKSLQRYLYRAVELDAAPWSTQATDQIEQIYTNVWAYLDRVPVTPVEGGNEVMALREQHAERARVVQEGLKSISALYAERIPEPNERKGIKQLLQSLKKEETKMRNYLAVNTVGTELTAEAKEATAIKRPGQVLNPNPILEQQAMERQKRDAEKKRSVEHKKKQAPKKKMHDKKITK